MRIRVMIAHGRRIMLAGLLLKRPRAKRAKFWRMTTPARVQLPVLTMPPPTVAVLKGKRCQESLRLEGKMVPDPFSPRAFTRSGALLVSNEIRREHEKVNS